MLAPTLADTLPPQGERKQAILLAAERLFAQRGYHAVSMREIAQAAGVPVALVAYHHGQKHELFEQVFRRWSPTLEERFARLREAQAAFGGQPGAGLLRGIVEAFVEPVLRLRASPEGEHYALLVARELAARTPEADSVLRHLFDPLAHAYIDALQAACPGTSRALAAFGYQFALGALLHHLGDLRITRLSHDEVQPGDPRAGALLVDFVVAGLQAVLSGTGTPGRAAAPPSSPARERSPATRRRPHR